MLSVIRPKRVPDRYTFMRVKRVKCLRERVSVIFAELTYHATPFSHVRDKSIR